MRLRWSFVPSTFRTQQEPRPIGVRSFDTNNARRAERRSGRGSGQTKERRADSECIFDIAAAVAVIARCDRKMKNRRREEAERERINKAAKEVLTIGCGEITVACNFQEYIVHFFFSSSCCFVLPCASSSLFLLLYVFSRPSHSCNTSSLL